MSDGSACDSTERYLRLAVLGDMTVMNGGAPILRHA